MRLAFERIGGLALPVFLVSCSGGTGLQELSDLPEARAESVCALWAVCPEVTRPYDTLELCEEGEEAYGGLVIEQECISNVALVQCFEGLERQRAAVSSGELQCDSPELYTLTVSCDRIAWDAPCGR
jgi:hypothetical protein